VTLVALDTIIVLAYLQMVSWCWSDNCAFIEC